MCSNAFDNITYSNKFPFFFCIKCSRIPLLKLIITKQIKLSIKCKCSNKRMKIEHYLYRDASRSPPQRDEYLNLRFPNETTKEKEIDSPSSESSLLSRRAMLRKYYLSHSFSSDLASYLKDLR